METQKPKAKRTKLKQEEVSSFPPWIDLPKDLTMNILHRLGAVEILENAQKVCKTWLQVCKDPQMWRVIDMRIQSFDVHMKFDLWKMCYEGLQRSQGQLIDLNLVYFPTPQLLYQIDGQQLKRLRFVSCYGISGKCLAQQVSKYSFSKNCILDMEDKVSAANVETIGRSCPMLKSFTFNEEAYYRPIKADELALAVSKSMPGLLHLTLCGSKMTNKGLKAILDGCPHLESLDLRECHNVDLKDGDIGTRCSRQIKNLKRPSDSTAGDYWTPICDPEQSMDKECGRIHDTSMYADSPPSRNPYISNDPYSSDSDYCGPDWDDYY